MNAVTYLTPVPMATTTDTDYLIQVYRDPTIPYDTVYRARLANNYHIAESGPTPDDAIAALITTLKLGEDTDHRLLSTKEK